MALKLRPVALREANAFVADLHRHHRPARGCRFCFGVEEGGTLRGVAIVGNPRARALDDGRTAEVIRVCTDGACNACSMLYGAAWRACRAIGYRRAITYTLPEEGGASLRAAGWRLVEEHAGGGSWHRPNIGRHRIDDHPTGEKWRWEVSLDG